MILYIFNQSFPDSSGFAKRCQMEIDALSKNHEITILCRGSTKKDTRLYESPYKQIQIMRFDNRVSLIERPRLYIPGAYEIYRNVYLLLSLGKGIFTFLKYKTPSNIQLYVVSSPLTVPLISYIIAKLTNIKCSFLEFHDLEP